jgi:hypothetical protein
MNWMIFDRDFQRSKTIATILLKRFGIKASRYDDAMRSSDSRTILLVHCDALHQNYMQLALLKLTSKYDFRFYCTDRKDRVAQVAYYLPDELERLVA